jgi:hypothetical protein
MMRRHSLNRVLRRLEKMADVNVPLKSDFDFRPLTDKEKKAFRKRAELSPWLNKVPDGK